MAGLEERDLRRLLDFLSDLHAPRSLEEFRQYVLLRLPSLVASERTAYNEVNLREQQIIGLIDPPSPSAEELAVRLAPFLWEHPLISRFERTRDGRAIKISDLMSRGVFHRTGLYNEFFRPLDIEDQMALGLNYDGQLIIAITLNRSRRSFTERDRLLLDTLRPHLAQAYTSAATFSQLQQQVALHGALWKSMSSGVLILDARGRVTFCSDKARILLRDYFDLPQACDIMPDELWNWLHARRLSTTMQAQHLLNSAQTLRRVRSNKSLIVRHSGKTEDGDLFLLDEEVQYTPLECLVRLGLTRRQSEVLMLLWHGLTNDEMAAQLKLSRHTLKRHLETIYEKLQVTNRNAAAHCAQQALNSVASRN
jgi:DNA-binding CsgD family transcriptional regulator